MQTAPVVARIEDSGMTIGTRINPPMGYTRVRAADGSLGAFLRTYPVKSAGSPVMLYDGTERTDAQAAAVLDIVLGKKNHEGPAGTAARLLSEYLYSVGNYKDISFRIGSKFSFSFDKWRKGQQAQRQGGRLGRRRTGQQRRGQLQVLSDDAVRLHLDVLAGGRHPEDRGRGLGRDSGGRSVHRHERRGQKRPA